MFNEWCKKWGVPIEAQEDLQRMLCLEYAKSDGREGREGNSEAAVQNQVRYDHANKGGLLWRNNVGVASDAYGNFIRYGLANDSKKVNAKIKSGDLIGIQPILIEQRHVGTYIGQFVSREVKRVGWKWRGTQREKAQAAWAMLVLSLGGSAAIVKGVD